MRLGGRISAAIEILDDIAIKNRPASLSLQDWGRANRFAGSSDRNAIGNMVYDTLRRRASLGFIADSEKNIDLVFATLIRQWHFEPEELAGLLEGDKFAPELPALEKLQQIRKTGLDNAPDPVLADMPGWCVEIFKTGFKQDWRKQAEALTERPPLDLRVNRLKQSREKALAQLSRSLKNTKFEATQFSPDGIRIAPGPRDARLPNITAEAAYQKGWLEVQDEGSQIAALLTGVMPGDKVLDFCAGAGGKTLALAAMMQNKGQIHAYDADKQRFSPIYERLKRAGTRNAQTHQPGSDLASLKGNMDLVLLDAPCTGSGVWRRRPDAKWKLTSKMLEQRCQEQRHVLDEAAQYVRPGGRLCYVTCSLLKAENHDQIEAFLSRHKGFGRGRLESIGALVPENGMITLSPAFTQTDGFFIGMVEKSD